MSPKKIYAIFIVLLILSIILIAIGASFMYIVKAATRKELYNKLEIKNGSEAFDNFVSPPVPIYMSFYFFTVLNPDDILSKKSNPVVKELGPYVYREIRDKVDISFSANGTKLSYTEPKSYVFEPSLSKGLENDSVTTINMFSLVAANTLNTKVDQLGKSHFITKALKKVVADGLILFNESFFKTHTVQELLWGYDEPTLSLFNKYLEKFLHIHIETKVGFFIGATGNGTNDGNYTIYTGVSDINMINSIDMWKGQKLLDYWSTPYGNMINGTDGTQWHPTIDKHERLYLFSTDICRSIYLEHSDTVTHKGIKMLRFSPPSAVLESGDNNPDNKCFCVGECLKDGAMDVSPCKENQPIVISLPHYYHGSKDYVNYITGMKPSRELHETRIDLEPLTGIAMQAAKRLQINFKINPIDTYRETKKFANNTLFPLMWLEESARLDDATADKFKSQVGRPMYIAHIMQWLMISTGLLLIVIAIAIAVRQYCKFRRNEHELLLPDQDEDVST